MGWDGPEMIIINGVFGVGRHTLDSSNPYSEIALLKHYLEAEQQEQKYPNQFDRAVGGLALSLADK